MILISFFSLTILSQILAPPFKLETQLSLTAEYISEIQRGDGRTFVISYELRRNDIPPRFRIMDINYAVVDAFNFEEGTVIVRSINIVDLDNDNEEEVVFLIRKGNKIELRILYPFQDVQKVIFSFDILKEYYSSNLIVLPTAEEGKYFVAIAELYPDENSLRGIASFNTDDLSLDWFLPLGEFVTSLNYAPATKSIYYTTISYSNELAFDPATSSYSHKGKPGRSVTNLFDNNSVIKNSFYSADTVSYLRRLSLSGELISSIKLGGKFTSSNVYYKTDSTLVGYIKFNSINDSQQFNLFSFNINENTIRHFFEYTLNNILTENILYVNDQIFLFNQLHKIYELTGKGEKIEVFDLSSYTTGHSYVSLNTISPYIRFEVGDKRYILDIEGNIIAQTSAYDDISYLNGLELFAIKEGSRFNLSSLVEQNFIDRITPNTYFFLSWVLGISTLFILFFWLLTMSISKKRILRQKIELEKSHRELTETTVKLIQAEKLAVLGTIASSVAHEINSPLGAIINSAERINHSEKIDEQILQNSQLIEKAAKRSKTIVEKFLIASRTDRSSDVANVWDVINDWKELFEKQFALHGININYDIDKNLIAKISPEELNQIFINLLSNAKDAILESNKDENIIDIFAKAEEARVIVAIEDTGSGFNDEMLLKACDAFITTKEPGKGTGLGLWICKKLIQDAGGEIQLSNSEKGARITLIIGRNEG
ncbi:MAG: ATP-binding protein [Melioribacteraceae bacterium]|nr:MAG: ATP-binding protein [Melioribacteraceae bacterium]